MEIRAWKGIRFRADIVGDPGLAVCPPYDVIDAEGQEELYGRSPWNMVRIVQGRRLPEDTAERNVYTRAADTFRGWIEAGALAEDPDPSLYVYRQDFEHGGSAYTRLGLIALLRLEEFGAGVMAHEKTLAGPKKDRLELTRATGAQFGNIFMLYDEPGKTVDALLQEAAEGEALLSYTDEDGVNHRLYAIRDAPKIEAACAALRGCAGMIADGHHRYETALNFSREHSGSEAAQHVMLTLVNMRNEGLLILPTHRLVKDVPDFDLDRLLGELESQFQIEEHSMDAGVPEALTGGLARCHSSGTPAFGLYGGAGRVFFLRLKDAAATAGLGDGRQSDAWRGMDVTVLHELILKGTLGIDEAALRDQTNVEYIKDIGDAVARAIGDVDSGRCQALFLQSPPRMSEMRAVCEAGERMPQKSTFFHPKIYTGLVIHKML